VGSRARALSILAVLAAGAIALRVFAPEVLEPKAAVAALRQAGEGWGGGLYVAAYIVLSTLAVPAVAMHVVAGVTFGFGKGALLCVLASNLASNLHFGLGRLMGPERVGAWLKKRGFKLERIENQSVTAFVLLRMIPFPFIAVNVACGAAPTRWRNFLIGSGLGLVGSASAQVFFAAQLYEGVQGAQLKALGWAAAAGALLVVLTLVPRWLYGRRNRQPPSA
jgi:uncharacterized membrane protein YdjX (TVP38/TMEM64 family)